MFVYIPAVIFWIFIIVFLVYMWVTAKPTKHYTNRKVIEKITNIQLPKYKIVEIQEGERDFTGDYRDIVIIEFETIPEENFYQTLDSICKNSPGITGLENDFEPDWTCRDGIYHYGRMWGNRLPAPNGENDKYDGFLNIEIERGNKQARIEYGMW
jgi:hypothetical protein